MSLPTLETPTPESYRLSWQEEGVVMEVTRIREERGDLISELVVMTTMPEDQLSRVKFNMLSDRAITTLANKLEKRTGNTYDFDKLLTQAAELVITRYRQGDPLVDLTQVKRRETRWLLKPFIENAGTSVLFAEEGAYKSFFALSMAVTVATGVPILGLEPEYTCPVAYLDFEADSETHAMRMDAICAPHNLVVPEDQLFYRFEVQSLSSAAESLRIMFAERNIGMVIVDSVGMARGGAPEAAEFTIKLARSSRSFVIPSLWIDHLAKSDINSKAKGMPFGSVYTQNTARLVWRMERDHKEGVDGLNVLVSNVQANNGPLSPRQGYAMKIANNELDVPQSVQYTRLAQADLPDELADGLSIREQIIRVLNNEQRPMKAHEITEILQEDQGTVGKTLRRGLEKTFGREPDEKGVMEWHLLEYPDEDMSADSPS